jgi:hypothetical protein
MRPLKERTRVIAVPANLPNDDLKTHELFVACLGLEFEVIGRNGNRIELAVGEVLNEAAHMHSIWIEEAYTDLSFPELRLSRKTLRFVIDAVEYRIAEFNRVIEDSVSTEDHIADASNDRMLLINCLDYLKLKAADKMEHLD